MLSRMAMRLYGLSNKLRGLYWLLFLRASGHTVAGKLRVGPGSSFRIHKGGRLVVSSGVRLGDHVRIEVRRGGFLQIGEKCKFTGYNWIVAAERIEFAEHCQLGEFSSVRDHQHGVVRDQLISEQPLVKGAIYLGRDVWIGRSALVLHDSSLDTGAIVAANAVFRGEAEAYGIYGGVPARRIKARPESQARPIN